MYRDDNLIKRKCLVVPKKGKTIRDIINKKIQKNKTYILNEKEILRLMRYADVYDADTNERLTTINYKNISNKTQTNIKPKSDNINKETVPEKNNFSNKKESEKKVAETKIDQSINNKKGAVNNNKINNLKQELNKEKFENINKK